MQQRGRADRTKREDISPSEDFHKTVKDLRVYARFPRRYKTEPHSQRKNDSGRFLCDDEIAGVEKKLLDEGQKINPIRWRNRMKQLTKMQLNAKQRQAKMHDIVRLSIDRHKYFKPSLMKEDPELCKLTGFIPMVNGRVDQKYFQRKVYTDLDQLCKQGLIHTKGAGNQKAWYVGPGPECVETEKDVEPAKMLSIPDKITIDINVKISFQ